MTDESCLELHYVYRKKKKANKSNEGTRTFSSHKVRIKQITFQYIYDSFAVEKRANRVV